jgi:hypothetical protein
MRKIVYIFLVSFYVLTLPAMAQWQLTGNSGTTPGTHFIGTTSNVGLMFKTNSTQSGYIDIVNTNTSFGQNAMASNTSGSYNTAFGTGPLQANTTGTNNLAIGTWALVTNTTSSYNFAIGRQTLSAITTGGFNTAAGFESMFKTTTGTNNTVFGFQTLYNNTSGTDNTVVGYTGGFDLTTGGDNTFVGFNAGKGITTGNNNTIIGANITGLSSSLSNNIIIADGQGNQRINVNNTGYVGIGIASPTAQLHTTGTVLFAGLPNNASAARVIVSDASGNLGYAAASSFSSGSSNWSTSGTNIQNANTGLVIIGPVPTTLPTDANLKLAVNGNIYSKKLVVTASGWADYVFAPEYRLLPLNDLEAYLATYRHLPEVPSAREVEQNGIDVGANQNILLKKVEELTLYAIEQNKKAEVQQKLIDDQHNLLLKLETEIEELKKHRL